MAKARCVAVYGTGVLFEGHSIEEVERVDKERKTRRLSFCAYKKYIWLMGGKQCEDK